MFFGTGHSEPASDFVSFRLSLILAFRFRNDSEPKLRNRAFVGNFVERIGRLAGFSRAACGDLPTTV
jgi:hypothetical protein